MFYKSTYQENLTTSEAIKEVTLEEVTWSWGEKRGRGGEEEEEEYGSAGDGQAGGTGAPPP